MIEYTSLMVDNNKMTVSLKVLKILICITFVYITVFSFLIPPLHDYGAYVRIWAIFLKTGHPYLQDGVFNGNAYGPLFILLAYAYKLHIFLPRFIFVAAWLATGLVILKQRTHNDLLFIWLI